MVSANTIKTRVQLKSDTEANWNKAGPKSGSPGFVPLLGELIVYTADDAHPFSRLKVGDGQTNVTLLPFIDAGTLNGELLPESEVKIYARRTSFPSPGEPNKLFIDLETKKIYCYTDAGGYTQISNFTYNTTKTNVSVIQQWNRGTMTKAELENGILYVKNGTTPSLSYTTASVVSDITKEG